MVGLPVRFLLCAWVLGGCVTSAAESDRPPDRAVRRVALRGAATFAAVLADRAEPDALSAYDVVILDPDQYAVEDVRALRGAGVLSLGYVNIGEIEAYRSFAGRVDSAWVVGENPLWPGHRFVDARHEGWRALVVDHVASRAVGREFDGLFLDMADVAAPGVFPETRDGIVALIRALREAYPTHVLVMNRGLFLLDDVADAIDGLLVEGVWARYDPAAQRYTRTDPAETDLLVRTLLAFRDATGGAAFAIDYADHPALRDHARQQAASADLPVFLSTIDLAGLGGE